MYIDTLIGECYIANSSKEYWLHTYSKYVAANDDRGGLDLACMYYNIASEKWKVFFAYLISHCQVETLDKL